MRQVSGEESEIVGASRTDSGAHARGQVCHFDTRCPIPPERWAAALNRLLPPDCAVVESSEVRPDFHSRFMARDRTYRYRFLVGKSDPFRARHTYRIPIWPDLEAMREAAGALIGHHDFRGLSEELEPDANSWRCVTRAEVRRVRDEIWVTVTANAFVRGMMRRIAGGLWEVGRGKRTVREFAKLLDEEQRREVDLPVVLPARGLTLMKVRFGRHLQDHRTLPDGESAPREIRAHTTGTRS